MENLDCWEIKTGTAAGLAFSPEYGAKVIRKAERFLHTNADQLFKAQTKKVGLPQRNAMIFDTVRYANSPVSRLRSRLLRLPRPYRSESMLATRDERTQKGKQKRGEVLAAVTSPRYQIKKSLVPVAPSNLTSKNMDYECSAAGKYRHLLERLDKKRRQEYQLTLEKNGVLKNVAQLRERIKEMSSADQEAAAARGGTLLPRAAEIGFAQMRLKRHHTIQTYGDQILQLRKEHDAKESALAKVQSKIESIKFEVARLREEQCEHYHGLLSGGLDTRQEGLSWIVKEIWALGRNVNLTKLPPYLDGKAVEYLFTVSLLRYHW